MDTPRNKKKADQEATDDKKYDGQYDEDFYMQPRFSMCDNTRYVSREVVDNHRYHRNNDLTTAFGLGFHPDDAIPKAGPGINSDIEQSISTCRLVSDFTYTNWSESIMPLSDTNIVEGLSEAVVMIANVAANGTESLKHQDFYLTVQFLLSIRDDFGEIPPNVLHFIEHVDYMTKNDGEEQV